MDVMDISGEHQTDLEHEITKTRLSKEGRVVETSKPGRELTGADDVGLTDSQS